MHYGEFQNAFRLSTLFNIGRNTKLKKYIYIRHALYCGRKHLMKLSIQCIYIILWNNLLFFPLSITQNKIVFISRVAKILIHIFTTTEIRVWRGFLLLYIIYPTYLTSRLIGTPPLYIFNARVSNSWSISPTLQTFRANISFDSFSRPVD